MTTFGKDDRPFDWVCAICDNGGEILSCRGSCLRSFHATPDRTLNCETLNFTEAQVEKMKIFLCDNCLCKKHQCYACGMLGSSAMSDREVYRCGSSDCGLHYHPYCVAKLLYQRDEAKVTRLAEKIKEGGVFMCPRHLCHICRGWENHKIKDLQFAICRRCPITYHRRCLPREIIFEDEDVYNLQRAWDDLLPDRILIYCMKHNIEKNLGTPMRNHLQFPPVQRSALTANQSNRSRPKEVSRSNHRPPLNKKLRVSDAGPHTGGPKMSAYGEKQKALESASVTEARLQRSSFPQISEKTEIDMRALLEEESSSVTVEEVRKRFKMPSIYCSSQRHICESINEEEVKAAVESAKAAWAKLRTHDGNIEAAKVICPPGTLRKICKWRTKLHVYLAPFIHGSRYTSFGRHFTKVDKLTEIVDKLHWYVQDEDMVVDFCCGSNDFSNLMSAKLASVGKKCLFKNFDLQQPKNDFNFEKRDWMTVEPEELPEGNRLIMGLNPPFGVKAALANKFINQALKFKPKILILIVPKETESFRLDRKHEYDLIWHDPCLLAGNSFYLPGSADNEHNQMEQWNLKPPPLYLWSRQDWAQLHREIANKHGHLSEEDKLFNEELSAKAEVTPNQLYYNSSEEDEDTIDIYNQNPDLLVKVSEVAELPPPPPLPVHPITEAQGKIDNKEHDPCVDLDFLSDMSISSPETEVKNCVRGQDSWHDVGFEAGPSATQFQFDNGRPEASSSFPFAYWGPSGFSDWWG